MDYESKLISIDRLLEWAGQLDVFAFQLLFISSHTAVCAYGEVEDADPTES